jgi:DNA-binding response OmpR family regulator
MKESICPSFFMQQHIPTLLIIEDDPTLQGLYADHCERLGFAVVQLYDGTTGFDYVKHENLNHLSVIILDYMLPEVSGRVILEEIKRREVTSPTLVISAIAEKSDDIQQLSPGSVIEIVKGDVPLHLIMESVSAYIRATHAGPEQQAVVA